MKISPQAKSSRPCWAAAALLLAAAPAWAQEVAPTRSANALAAEKSPYLEEHAHDPVQWQPWGKAAFEEAKRRDVPLFVSSGYSTCHWCHVMHKESFEDEEVAKKLNASFVCVKVDREELPDVDESLIRAVQAIKGDAGWPCTVFLLPDGRPFYGGTYFPKNALLELLDTIAGFWKDPEKRKGIANDAKELTDFLRRPDEAVKGDLDRSILRNAVLVYSKSFDAKNGGFGKAPKFPRAPDLHFLLRHSHSDRARLMALFTLDRILRGGIHDHVGGGFHRYSVDEEWRVPHFEKTLYDQALLAGAFADAFGLTKEPRYAEALRTTCDYVLRDLRLPSGGFAAAEDADSEGQEGRFYTWTRSELVAALGDEKLASAAAERFGVEASGPVDGRSVLFLAGPDDSNDRKILAALLAARGKRARPRRDSKVLAGWNGLMIGALARASAVLEEPRFLEAAKEAARLVSTKLVSAEGRLLRRMIDGEARFHGALEDHAYLVAAYVELYEASLEPEWLEKARALLAKTKELHWDGTRFRSRAKDAEPLVPSAPDSPGEGALPGPAAVLAACDARLAALTATEPLLARSELESIGAFLAKEPEAAPTSLGALDLLLAEPVTIVVSGARGEATDALLRAARQHAPPHAVLALVDGEAAKKALGELARGRDPGEKPRAFVCTGKTCKEPVSDAAALGELLDGLRR